MVKFLAVISLAAAVACVRAHGLIGAPAAVYGPPAIRTLEPALPAVLPPVVHTVPHLLSPPRVVTQIVREQVAVPIHHAPLFDALPASILPAPILPAPIFPAPIVAPLPAPFLPAPILPAPIPDLLPAPIPDLLPAPILPARTYGVPTL